MFALQTALKDLRRRLRDPLSLCLWVGIPLAIGLMLSLAFGGDGGGRPTARILVADQDGTFLSGLVLRALEAGTDQDLPFAAELVELDEGRARLDAGDGSALLVLPAGFADSVLLREPCQLELVKNPAQRILPVMVEEAVELLVDAVFYLHQVFGDVLDEVVVEPPPGEVTLPDLQVAEVAVAINQRIEGLEGLLFPPVIRLELEGAGEGDAEGEAEEAGSPNFAGLFFPSMLLMTIVFLAQGVSEDVWVEKEGGTLRRALSTPNRAAGFLLGKLIAATVLIGAISLVAFALAGFAFGITVHDLPLAVAWAGLSGGAFAVLLFLIQMFASSQRGGSLLTSLIVMPLLMVGGSFFPFEAMPDWMAAIGSKTPNGWALVELKTILRGDVELRGLARAAAGMVGVGFLLFLFAVRRMRGAFVRG